MGSFSQWDSIESTSSYFKALGSHLKKLRNWELRKEDNITYRIVDSTGDPIGKISREVRGEIMVMHNLSAAFVDANKNIIKINNSLSNPAIDAHAEGLGIMESVYPFEREWMKRNKIKTIEVEIASPAVKKKFEKYFSDFRIVKPLHYESNMRK